jgi:hypothetical protein
MAPKLLEEPIVVTPRVPVQADSRHRERSVRLPFHQDDRGLVPGLPREQVRPDFLDGLAGRTSGAQDVFQERLSLQSSLALMIV